MAQSKTFHGARAKVNIGTNTVGIFTSVSYGVTYDVQPVSIMGRYAPVETVYTGQEAISIQATGWRVIGHGPHDPKGIQMPKLQELMKAEDITISLYDRQDDKNPIMVVVGCRCAGFSTSLNARGLQEISVNFIGLQLSDESGDQNEPGATDLP